MVAVAFVLMATTGLFISTGLARAACQPGQMEEARLAFKSASQSLHAQQWDQAISQLKSIIGMCPEYVEAQRGLGDAYAGKGDFATAVTHYRTVINLRGQEAQAGDFANIGKAYAKQKMYKEARAEYMKAEDLAPDDCGVLFNLGVMHYAAAYNVQSVAALEHALEVCPDIREHILKQLSKSATAAAKQQRKLGNNEKAKHYDNLMNEYGGAAGGSTTYDLATQKFKAKQYGEAAALLEKLVAKEPGKTSAWLTLARAYDAKGDKAASLKAYAKYFELKPRDTKNMGTYIQVMVEDEQCSAAAAKAAEGVRTLASQGKKNLAGIYYSWGLALECQEDYEGAMEKFRMAATSGNSKYSGPGQTQVQRMSDMMKVKAAEKKKANQKR